MSTASTTSPKKIKFIPVEAKTFYATLNKRVNAYFKEASISKNANTAMYIKTINMLLIYFVPYALILLQVGPPWLWLIFAFIMGVGKATIGMAVMHDANHGSYFKKANANKWMGYTLNAVGGSSTNWRIQHNVLHHTYTNIDGHDEDISPAGLVRFSPHAPYHKIHRWQHFYTWPLYLIQTFFWILLKDWRKLAEYQSKGLLKAQKQNAAWEWTKLVATKVIYVAYILVIPALLLPVSFGWIFLGFCIMHAVAGFGLAVVFQCAHVVEETEFPLPDETDGNIKNAWAVHQLATTMNFAPKNWVLNWFIGGLNYQVEHHLFPHICHVHYPNISSIVKETALEFNLPYYQKRSFRGAIISHYNMLKSLGKKPAIAA